MDIKTIMLGGAAIIYVTSLILCYFIKGGTYFLDKKRELQKLMQLTKEEKKAEEKKDLKETFKLIFKNKFLFISVLSAASISSLYLLLTLYLCNYIDEESF